MARPALLAAALLALAGAPATAQVVIPDQADPLLTGLSIPADAPTRGMWSPVRPWPLVALHQVLLPTGVVLSYGTPLGQGVQDGRTFDIWDPARGLDPQSHLTLPNAQAVDSFCAASAWLPNGAILISGGNTPASGRSALTSTAFDPARERAGDVATNLASPRWYGSMITLPDGRALMAGGGVPYVVNAYQNPAAALAANQISMTPEIFTPGAGWIRLAGATSRDAFGPDLNRWWYPRLWVAPDGSVVGLSSDKLWRMTTAGNGSITTTATFKSGWFGQARPNVGPTSTAAMYDVGLILQLGGNGAANGHATPSSAAATVIDVNGPTPVLREQPAMANPRQWANATVLADGRVVVTGGTRFADNAGADAVYAAEIWNPATGTWTTGRPAAVYRGYHSAAILLPNGTILTTGGGVPGPATNLNAEIYYPPNLFRTVNGVAQLAPRPRIASISAQRGTWGQTLSLGMATSASIRQVALLGLGQTTHSFNSGQRRVPLQITQTGTQLAVRLPASANLAPPGYYMLVAIDQAGVPSRGVIVAIEAPAPPPRPAQPSLQADTSRSLQAVNVPDRVVRQRSQLTFLDPVSAASPVNDRLDASFIVRPGLADPSCHSFESRRLPGQYLRHYGYRLRVDPLSSATLYRQDATFCPRRPLDNSADPTRISLESLNYPGRFLRHRNYEIWTDLFDGTPLFQQDSSFTVIPGLQ